MHSKTIYPIRPDLIDADPSVRYSFQTDENFKKIHETSPLAHGSYQIAKPCIEAATRMAVEAGLPGLDRIVATSEGSRLMIFPVESTDAEPAGRRILGLTTEPSVTIDEAVEFVQSLT